jgi:uncharacterized protein YndB with AHSA1/START domain
MSESYRASIDIAAAQDRVFDYFVKPELLVRWMGDFARLEARAGGLFAVNINGVVIRGHFVRVERPNLVEIAWGEAGNDAMPPGSTRVVSHALSPPVGHGISARLRCPLPGLATPVADPEEVAE